MHISLSIIPEHTALVPQHEQPHIEFTQEEVRKFLALYGSSITMRAVNPDFQIVEEYRSIPLTLIMDGTTTNTDPYFLGNILLIEHFLDNNKGSIIFCLACDEEGDWTKAPRMLKLDHDLAGRNFPPDVLQKLALLTFDQD